MVNKIYFIKMSGAGNDFIVVDKKINPGVFFDDALIRRLCNRRTGIGADGLIAISDSDVCDFEMEYFNADGSTGSLCGNGARCAVKFAELSNRLQKNETKFLSNKTTYKGEILGENEIKFYFNFPENFKFDFILNVEGQNIKANYVDTGSPHVIIKIEDVLKIPGNSSSLYRNLTDFPVYTLGKEIRNHPLFTPGGTNVNFIKIKDDKIYIRTYERGVEDETFACGTGSTAAGLIAYYRYNLKPPISLITKGGDELKVDFNFDGEKIKNLSLTGPAITVFTGEILLNRFINLGSSNGKSDI